MNINIDQHIWACGTIIAYKTEYNDPSATWEKPIVQKGKLKLFGPVLTIFCRPSANQYSCCKFITAMLLPCPENSISPFLSSLRSFWPLFKVSWFLEMFAYTGLSTQMSFSLKSLSSNKILHLPPFIAKEVSSD